MVLLCLVFSSGPASQYRCLLVKVFGSSALILHYVFKLVLCLPGLASSEGERSLPKFHTSTDPRLIHTRIFLSEIKLIQILSLTTKYSKYVVNHKTYKLEK